MPLLSLLIFLLLIVLILYVRDLVVKLFESQMMDLSVKISLEDALNNGWKILAECFNPQETSFRSDLIKEFWPQKEEDKSQKSEDAE